MRKLAIPLSVLFMIVVGAQAAADHSPEIPKNTMTPAASSLASQTPSVWRLIDGRLDRFVETDEKIDGWFQLQFTGRVNVEGITYVSRQDYGDTIKDYEVYVTDDPDRANWGTAVASGTFPNVDDPQHVAFTPKAGSYVILFGRNSYLSGTHIACAELSAFGTAATGITDFEVADQTTSHTRVVHSTTVNVTAFDVEPAGDPVTDYLVALAGDVPDAADGRWGTTPATYTIDPAPAENSYATVVGWIKTASGSIIHSIPQTLFYMPVSREIPKNTLTPSVSSLSSQQIGYLLDNRSDRYMVTGSSTDEWFMLQFTGRVNVGVFTYQGRLPQYACNIMDYELYVTDDPDNWGAPVTTGTFENTDYVQEPRDIPLPTPKAGSYVILKGLTNSVSWSNIACSELWVYGTAAPGITNFQVADEITGDTKVVHSTTVNVTAFDVDPADETVDGYMVALAGDVPLVGDGRWDTEPFTYTIVPTPAEHGYATVVGWIRTAEGSIINSAPQTLLYMPQFREIPKNTMTPSASSVSSQLLSNLLDNKEWTYLSTGSTTNEWFMLQFTGRYNVGLLTYLGKQGQYATSIKDYEVYVTDDPDPANWGASVASGTFEDTGAVQEPRDIPLTPKEGAYVIIKGLNNYGPNRIQCSELWVYGTGVPGITNFQVADETTGDTRVVHSTTVNVTAFDVDPAGQTVDGYMVALAGDVPLVGDGRWDTEPFTYTIDPTPAEHAYATVVGWIRTAEGAIVFSPPQTLLYMPQFREIDKGTMTPSASSVGGQTVGKIIDGNVATNNYMETGSPTNEWLMLQFTGRYNVGLLTYQGRGDQYPGNIGNYEVYVTDDPDPANWGAPVASGTFADTGAVQEPRDIPLTPKIGSYVILKGLDYFPDYSRIACRELWVYGLAAPGITSFQVADETTGDTRVVHSTTVDVTAFDVDPADETVDGYMVALAGDVPLVGDGRWDTEPFTYTIVPTPAEHGYATVVGWIRTAEGSIIGSTPQTLLYMPQFREIPKNTMTPTASSVGGQTIGKIIDGNVATNNYMETGSSTNEWLQLQFTGRYTVGLLTYMGRADQYASNIRDYEVYVTDDPANWGAPVASGTFADTGAVQEPRDIPLPPTKGGYVILKGLNNFPDYSRIACRELWVYGLAAPGITNFQVADETTGDTRVVHSAAVEVTAFDVDSAGQTVDGYMVALAGDVPDAGDGRWGTEPTSYTIDPLPAEHGYATVVGWIRTAEGSIVQSAPQTLLYMPQFTEIDKGAMTPTASSVAEQVIGNVIDDNPSTFMSTSERNNGWIQLELPETQTVGFLSYQGRIGQYATTILDYEVYVTDDPQNWGDPVASGTFAFNQQVQDVPLTPKEGDYVILLGLNDYYNFRIYCGELWVYGTTDLGPPALEGDVNGDCKVNILDMIGIRNHLNQDPNSPPENAVYDVTGDGNINILDMIYVRNRLNTVCEE